MCATKLHGAKIDCPAVAGPSFFAIRWRTETTFYFNVDCQMLGQVNKVLFYSSDQIKYIIKYLRELLHFISGSRRQAGTPGGLRADYMSSPAV